MTPPAQNHSLLNSLFPDWNDPIPLNQVSIRDIPALARKSLPKVATENSRLELDAKNVTPLASETSAKLSNGEAPPTDPWTATEASPLIGRNLVTSQLPQGFWNPLERDTLLSTAEPAHTATPCKPEEEKESTYRLIAKYRSAMIEIRCLLEELQPTEPPWIEKYRAAEEVVRNIDTKDLRSFFQQDLASFLSWKTKHLLTIHQLSELGKILESEDTTPAFDLLVDLVDESLQEEISLVSF